MPARNWGTGRPDREEATEPSPKNHPAGKHATGTRGNIGEANIDSVSTVITVWIQDKDRKE